MLLAEKSLEQIEAGRISADVFSYSTGEVGVFRIHIDRDWQKKGGKLESMEQELGKSPLNADI